MSVAYRPEVDGLRALAVLPVILFHGGFTAFQGGFVGVDVFFVISGYLITSILLADLAAGKFSMVDFWERRARRILPALFVVMLFCLPAAWVWLLPPDLVVFGKSLVGVSLYSSNLLFWQTSDYFAPAAELNPLLHTWSLAVEEQYYLLFPPVLLLLWRWGRSVTAMFVAVGALASLLIAQRWLGSDATGAYFLLPSRAWELGIGALLALCKNSAPAPLRWRAVAEAGAAAGLALLIYAVVAFDSRTPFPGVYALVPTVGTALLLGFGTQDTVVGRVLGWRPLVAVGLISYSAYLWHQPLFAFARHASLATPSPLLMLGLSVLALVVGFFSWKYVEAPFRDRQRFPRRPVFWCATLGSVFFAGCGATLVAGDGIPSRLSVGQQAVAAYAHYDYQPVQRSFRCQLMRQQRPAEFAAECIPPGSAPAGSMPAGSAPGGPASATVLVWGDSHAAALAYGLRSQAPGVAQLTAASCPPIPGVRSAKAFCNEINDYVLDWVKQHRPGLVLLHAAWRKYPEAHDLARFGKLVAELRNRVPETRVVVLGSAPAWDPTLPQLLIKAGVGLDAAATFHPPAWEELQRTDAALRAAVVPHGAEFVSLLALGCPAQQCPVVVREADHWALTAWDDGHFTAAGSKRMAENLWPALAFRPRDPQ